MKIIDNENTTTKKEEFLKQIHPLNPYTRQGCPCCPRMSICKQFVIANTRHYTMGRCINTDKHMIQDYGVTIAAWAISQSCPGTWMTHDPYTQNAMKHILVIRQNEAAQSKRSTPHPVLPRVTSLNPPNSQYKQYRERPDTTTHHPHKRRRPPIRH